MARSRSPLASCVVEAERVDERLIVGGVVAGCDGRRLPVRLGGEPRARTSVTHSWIGRMPWSRIRWRYRRTRSAPDACSSGSAMCLTLEVARSHPAA